jgi:diguanylate cyclase (GGDEF)-like protein
LILVAVVLWSTSYLAVAHGTPSSPGLTLGLFFVTLYTATAVRLKLPQMLLSCLSGDLSPEEAWAWRGQLDVAQPAVLFGTSGRVKRANAAAVQAFGLTTQAGDPAGRTLSKLCCPEWGQRAARVGTQCGERRSWDLIWPHSELPLVLFNDVTTVTLEHEKLRHQLLHDPLTGTLNRRGFEEAAADLQRQGSHDYAVLFMDMNGFKQVNDQQGHEAGDRLLQQAAERFLSTLRPSDKLSRWGGDEYAILMLGQASLESVAVLAARLESVLREPIDLGTVVVKVGVAVGFAVPEPGEAFAAVLQRADEAMYARKAYLKSARTAVESA